MDEHQIADSGGNWSEIELLSGGELSSEKNMLPIDSSIVWAIWASVRRISKVQLEWIPPALMSHT